jgi:integrase
VELSRPKRDGKRGFATKREAQEWERKFQLQNSADLDMDFEAFTELYANDVKNRLKENTWLTKEHIIRTKILPYFGKMKISEIGTKEIIAWQNELLAYRDEKRNPYSQTYLKTVHNQLSAIFNHAVRYYDLRSNPAAKAGNMGSEEHKEIQDLALPHKKVPLHIPEIKLHRHQSPPPFRHAIRLFPGFAKNSPLVLSIRSGM